MYKHSHTLTHRQPEKYPRRRPLELRCIHTSELLSIHWRMVHTSMLRCIDHPYIRGSIVHTSEDGPYQNPYIGGWSIDRNSDVWTIQTSELLSIHWSAIHISELRCSNMYSNVWLRLYDPERVPFSGSDYSKNISDPHLILLICGEIAQMVKWWTVEWEVPG